MSTHVIILAQGQQTRLQSVLDFPKQLVPLRGPLGDKREPRILTRTLRQISELLAYNQHITTVVSWAEIHQHYAAHPIRIPNVPYNGMNPEPLRYVPEFTSLVDPGNSSLLGLKKYIDQKVNHVSNRCVVLLGDVVYSWKCLDALLLGSGKGNEPLGAAQRDVRDKAVFAGTSNLSSSGGELWGVAWQTHRKEMLETLHVAATKHPKVKDTYQPGQLRRWWWEVRDLSIARGERYYWPCDDYTMDVDTPADLLRLPAAAELALADDLQHGVTW